MKEVKDFSNLPIDKIQLNKEKINDEIKKTGKYISEGVNIIKKWENNDFADSYIADISTKVVDFKGILNGRLQREGYGINLGKKKGDIYFGYFENDQRNKNGVFYWPKEKEGSKLEKSECYHGFWRDNSKDGRGIYLWLSEEKGNTNFDLANFDAYIGEFEMDKYKRGTYLVKDKDEYFVYHGNIDEDGNRNDNNAFYYSAQKDMLLNGKVVNNVFENGYVAYFNNDGVIYQMIYCEFSDNGIVKSVKKVEEMTEIESKSASNQMTTFRNVILEYDFFGNIYNKYKEILNFVDKNMRSIDIFDNEEKYPEIIKLSVGYNELNLFNNIEKKVLSKLKK